jgi:hypothetical protein
MEKLPGAEKCKLLKNNIKNKYSNTMREVSLTTCRFVDILSVKVRKYPL